MAKKQSKKEEFKTKEFESLWNRMPESLRRKRLEKAYRIMRPVIKNQLLILNDYEKSTDKIKQVGHIYVFRTVRNFWDNAELAFLMRKNKSMKNFIFYPVRTCMETLMRFIYFCETPQSEKDIISRKEILRIYVRLYKRNQLDGLSNIKNIEAYNTLANGLGIPDINHVNNKNLDPFPQMPELCNKSGMKNSKTLYFLYQFLCESSHGKLIATVIRYQAKEFEEYRRAFMLLIMLCKEMLILADKNFFSAELRSQVEPCIKEVDKIIMGPKSFYERSYLLYTNFRKNLVK